MIDFSIVEWGHDTPGKIVSFLLRLQGTGAVEINIQLTPPEVKRLVTVLTEELTREEHRISERYQ